MSALEGVRVLDLSTGVAGPVATMFMADFGAEVIKVEPPGGDPARAEPGFATWNRGKRSIVADPAEPAHRARLDRLLRGTDLLVIGDRDAAAQDGIDVDAITAGHPGLVVLHLPPYHGPAPWLGGGESHGMLTAVTGVSLRQASFEGGPIEFVIPKLLYIQGIWGATCGLAALLERRASGFGQVVTVSGVHAMMEAFTSHLTVRPDAPPVTASFGPGGPNPSYSRFRCADGEWMFVAALTPKFQAQLLKVLDIEDVLDDPRLGGQLEKVLLPENRDWVRKRVEAVFGSASRAHWLEVLAAADVPAGPLLERADWLDHPQIKAIGMRAEVDDPERGRVVMPGVPIVLTGTPGSVQAPAPRLAEHEDDLPDWDPRPQPTGNPPAAAAGPLAGYQVLDLGAILAGPYAGSLLAELGASVIKVEPPAGDSFRVRGFTFNRGMRGLAIDLRADRGKDAFYRLAEHSDVVIDNYRPGVLDRLKIDYGTLSRVNPEIVTVSLTGFGEGGPMSDLPGFDPILQAASGMMTAQGGDHEPVFYTIAINDVASAVLTTFSVTAALLHRQATGAGQRIWSSLAGASAIMQSGELTRYAGRPPACTGGRDFAGREPLRRFYTVADGWVRVEATPEQVDSAALHAAGLPGFDGFSAPAGAASEGVGSPARAAEPGAASEEANSTARAAELDAALEAALAGVPRDEAVRRLNAAAVPCVPVRQLNEMLSDEALMSRDVLQLNELSDGTPYTTTARFAALSRTQRGDVLTPPGIGEHSTAVLTEAGLTPAEVEGLIAEGVVVQGQPMEVVLLTNYR
ncbi:MAG: CoA transferase [Streptosporangiales bacterium]|nr:CoA transferase [Streptosporangiales bacterium]